MKVRRIAKGLEILHGHKPPIAHGHLKAVRTHSEFYVEALITFTKTNLISSHQSNIMINHRGDPLLGDFGLSKVSGDARLKIASFNYYLFT